ncbi:MAG: hypothetical protein J6X44_06295 [Thermoguttaceae bacterium]|nr:hypothetical protein [Thermoguttaceae bacterium]
MNSIEAGFRSTTLIRSGANNGFDALRKSSGRFAANARPPSSYADGSRRYRAGIGFNVLRKISTETLKRKLACFGVALSACGVRAILALPLAALIYCGGSYAQAIGWLVSLVSA